MYLGDEQNPEKHGSDSVHPHQLKLDADYENKILSQLKSCGMFEPTLHPDALYTLINRDLASANINHALVNAEKHGIEHMLNFIKSRFMSGPDTPDHSGIRFTARFTKVKAPTLNNIYDV